MAALRKAVADFVAIGGLPSESASAELIDRAQSALERIEPPITDSEARALVECFGPDECCGLAWTLVHLIETAPSPVLWEEPVESENSWMKILYARAKN